VRKTAVVALCLAAASSAAHAEIVPIAWDHAGRFETTARVQPGKVVEVCGKLARAETVQWSFESPAPLDFNIHYHEGAKVVYPDKREGKAASSGTLLTQSTQDYCWMWTHRGSAATTLRMSLQRSRP
jgi:hypothetical protein